MIQNPSREPARRATDTPEMFDLVTAHFRPPSPDEGFDVIVHDV